MSDRTVDAVLFDLDGTLVDSHRTIAAAMVEALGAAGYPITAEQLIPMIGPPMNTLAIHLGASAEESERINTDYLRIYHDGYIQETPEHEGATALLDRLAGAGIALGIVTNKVEAGARLVVEVEGWQDRFGVVVGRDTPNAAAKPSPEAALHALRVLGVPPERAAFVGDTEFDVRCARDAGIPHVIVLDANRDPAFLRAEGATSVIHRLEQVGTLLLGAPTVADAQDGAAS
ncbi:MAG: HAD family hydrolase [Dehalococcoidia bacterium]